MSTKKVEYYNLDKILQENAQYNLIYGKRSNGKSYAIKDKCIRDYLDYGGQFIYLRRYDIDIKSSEVERYFEDTPIYAYTHGEYNGISVYRRGIYLTKFEEGKIEKRGDCIGYCMALSASEHYKSTAYPRVTNFIFEEFLTKGMYLRNEPDLLMDVLSTVFRNRKGTIYLIGNTISRICPYFSEWKLTNIRKQKIGTIETYDTGNVDYEGNPILIAVEFCKQSAKNALFFGEKEKNINIGEWEKEKVTILRTKFHENDVKYAITYIYDSMMFNVNVMQNKKTGYNFLYIYPAKNVRHKRIVSDVFSESPLVSTKLIPITYGDKIILELWKNKKVVFSDSYTGTDFIQIVAQKGGI